MNRHQKIKLYLFFFFLIAAVIFGVLFPRLTVPFGCAYIIYLMVQPLTLRMVKGTPRQRFMYTTLMLIILSLSLFPVMGTFYNFDADLGDFVGRLPEVQKILQEKFFAFKVKVFEKFGIQLKLDPITLIMGKAESRGMDLISKFPEYLSVVFEWLLLVPLFLYFFFVESKNFSRKFLELIPNPIFEKAYVLFSQFNTKFGEYIIAKFIEATILGSLVTIGLLFYDFPYPFILGFIAGVTNILPYIGPLIGFVPAILIALLSEDPNISIWGISIIYLVANLIDMILVFPLLVSKIVNLHPVVVVVSIIIGSQVGGIIGMIVIIPFIAFFKLLFVEIYKDLSVHL